jgi:hypothetical protein
MWNENKMQEITNIEVNHLTASPKVCGNFITLPKKINIVLWFKIM